MILDSLNKFRKDHPDPLKAAFFMTKFSNNKPYVDIFNVLKEIYSANGIKLLRADDKMYHQDLYWNIETYIRCCASGIAFFDTMENEDFNPNVAFEVGYMMSLNKPVCLLKNKLNKNLPSDLMGKLYVNLDPFNIESSLHKPVSTWLADNDLCLTCSECFITLKEDLFLTDVTIAKFEGIDNKIRALKQPNHILTYKGVARNESGNTVFSYECNHDFFQCIHNYFKNGALENSVGRKVLSVSQYKNAGYKNYDFTHSVRTFKPGNPEAEKLVQVCKLAGISTFEKEKYVAESFFVVPETTDLNQIEVYITGSRENLFYFHSNFRITGFDYPTKLLVYDDYYNLLEILKILVTNNYPYLQKTDDSLLLSHCTKVKYYIDRSMINEQGLCKIDLDGARNIKLVS
jgi:hypothetical protein